MLSRRFDVTIVTPFPYSQLRLATLGREFQINVAACRLATYDPSAAPPDLWVAMGNHVVPSVPARGRENWYVCQFPFGMDAAAFARERANLGGYQRVLVYSNYARAHLNRAFAESGMAPVPVRVVYPPVPILDGDPARKDRTILSVGRFFAGGHSKRHDVMLEAFRELLGRVGDVELHLAGSSSPLQANMEYVAQLQTMATDLPVTFHLNPSPQTLRALYARAPIYWHATGFGQPPDDAGEKAEHFGISIVEAMSAGCVPLAYATGGPCEIIEDGISGFLFDSSDTLLSKTAAMLEAGAEADRIAIARRAAAAARRYAAEVFADAMWNLIREAGLMPAPSPFEGLLGSG